MITQTYQTTAISPAQPMLPYWAEIDDIQSEAPGVSTLWLRFVKSSLQDGYRFKAGQFNLISVPGVGECALSISSSPEESSRIAHTVRFSGNVTSAISQLRVGDQIGVRGPFGTHWPLENYEDQDIVIAAGGIGLPPIRPIIYQIMNHREKYKRVIVLYGARTPQDLQFTREYKEWEKADIELMVTVDRADENWKGLVGVVPILFYKLRVDPHSSVIFTCGPEIMIRFVIFEALARRIPADRIYVSMERNMKCGLGFCGHCQYGPLFVCKDGPVFTYKQVEPYVNVEDL